jgi:predicted ATPase/Tfp pilus assembly protein PilF
LRQLALNVLGVLVNAALEQSQFAYGIGLARRLLSLKPWHEAAHRQLMKLLVAEGQVSAALAQYETCRRLLAEELQVAPSAETAALYEAIRAGQPGQPQPARLKTTTADPPPEPGSLPPHNIPVATTSFVGRQTEQAQIAGLLADADCRLVTIIGPGGMGKTRLAQKVASDQIKPDTAFRHGIYFVPLGFISPALSAAAADSNPVVPAIGAALGIPFSGSAPLKTQLLNAIREKMMLLVLDNFEHLADQAGQVVEILEQAPGLKIVVTSRKRLNLYEEWVFDLWGLAYPAQDDAAVLNAFDSIQLFEQRARQVYREFDLTAELTHVARICRLLEGMPLGLELAATWVRVLPCRDIAQEIEQNLDFLTTQARHIPDRQRSLRAVFDHSWHMLEPLEQEIFSRLSVFSGGFTTEAAVEIAGASLLVLSNLVDKSLLQRPVARRYGIHELLRQYGAQKLSDVAQSAARWRHCGFYASFLRRREPLRQTGQEPPALREIETELDNIQAGWQWLIQHLAALDQVEPIVEHFQDYAPMLAYFYERRSRFQEGSRVFEQAATAMEAAGWLDRDLSEAARLEKQVSLALIWSCKARLCFNLGHFAELEQLVERSLPVLRQAGKRQEIAVALAYLGKTYDRIGKYDQARGCLQESLALFREIGDRVGSTVTLNGLGMLANSEGRYDEARGFFEECLAIFNETGYQKGVANMLSNLGTSYLRHGNYEQAKPCYEKAFEAAKAAGEDLIIAVTLSGLGSISRIMSAYETSLRYYKESVAMFRKMREQRWTAASLNGLGLTLLDMADLAAAKRCHRESLEISLAIQSIPDVLDSLAALSEILAKEGHREKAVGVGSFVANHAVTKTMARQRSKQVLARLKEEMPVDVWERAYEWGRGETIEGVVDEVGN